MTIPCDAKRSCRRRSVVLRRGNDFIAMLKDSALISVLALPDLLQLGRLYISRTFRAFEGTTRLRCSTC